MLWKPCLFSGCVEYKLQLQLQIESVLNINFIDILSVYGQSGMDLTKFGFSVSNDNEKWNVKKTTNIQDKIKKVAFDNKTKRIF